MAVTQWKNSDLVICQARNSQIRQTRNLSLIFPVGEKFFEGVYVCETGVKMQFVCCSVTSGAM